MSRTTSKTALYQIAREISDSHSKAIERLAKRIVSDAYSLARKRGISTYAKSGKYSCMATESWLTICMLITQLSSWSYHITMAKMNLEMKRLRSKEFDAQIARRSKR